MKICPACGQTYAGPVLFCLRDGERLVSASGGEEAPDLGDGSSKANALEGAARQRLAVPQGDEGPVPGAEASDSLLSPEEGAMRTLPFGLLQVPELAAADASAAPEDAAVSPESAAEAPSSRSGSESPVGSDDKAVAVETTGAMARNGDRGSEAGQEADVPGARTVLVKPLVANPDEALSLPRRRGAIAVGVLLILASVVALAVGLTRPDDSAISGLSKDTSKPSPRLLPKSSAAPRKTPAIVSSPRPEAKKGSMPSSEESLASSSKARRSSSSSPGAAMHHDARRPRPSPASSKKRTLSPSPTRSRVSAALAAAPRRRVGSSRLKPSSGSKQVTPKKRVSLNKNRSTSSIQTRKKHPSRSRSDKKSGRRAFETERTLDPFAD